MNERLERAYKELKERNHDRLIKNEIELDSEWGKETWGITFQIDIADSVKDKLCALQDSLRVLEPDTFLFPPRHSQHVSFNQIIFWNGAYIKGKEKTWVDIKEEFLQRIGSLKGLLPPFEITFKEVVATGSGIIWCAYDEHDEMEQMRELFSEKLPFPEETTKKNHIIHTTAARYKSRLSDPTELLTRLDGMRVEAAMMVKSIMLRKELVFPSLKTETITTINL